MSSDNGNDPQRWQVTMPIFVGGIVLCFSANWALLQFQHTTAERRDAVQFESLEARCDRQDARMGRIEIGQRLFYALTYDDGVPLSDAIDKLQPILDEP